jgi:hypothetical protein
MAANGLESVRVSRPVVDVQRPEDGQPGPRPAEADGFFLRSVGYPDG